MEMMENQTVSFYFNLTMFMKIGHYRYLAFVCCLLIYSFIVFANGVLIVVIARESALHQPMYIFIAFLSFNALYGSTAFFPRFLMDLLSDTHLISRPGCFTQIYVIYTYASYELTILCVMAYDRFVAVCHPLHYSRKMNSRVVCILGCVAWVAPACNLSIYMSTIVRLQLCGNKIYKIYCASWNIALLACDPRSVNSIAATVGAVIITALPFSFILYTYLRIVLACWKQTSEVRGKVLQSCLPHVFSFAIYILTSFTDTALSRQNLKGVNPFFAVVLAMEFIIIPPFTNPLVYGLKLPEIRRKIFKMLKPPKST